MSVLWKLSIFSCLVSISAIAGIVRPFPGEANTSVKFAPDPSPQDNLLTQICPPANPGCQPGGYVPPPPEAFERSKPFAIESRGGRCEADQELDQGLIGRSLAPLTPNLPNHPPRSGLTVSASPQFFIYSPQTTASTAEFVLKDQNEEDIYRKTFPISGEAKTLVIRLPESVNLEVNRSYHWYFSIVCDPDNLSKNVDINAWTQRIAVNPALANELENADSLTQSGLYAQTGIWYDAIAILAQLRQENSDDAIAAEKWKNLLNSAGLQEFVSIPIETISLEESTEQ
jgi:Domain of Unknown Function (DUF928)